MTPELIAVAGSQHDNSSGNKMMFIGQAVRELAEFKRNRPALARTLVLFTPSYNDAMLNAARDSAKAYGAALVEVTSTQALIDYLNQGRDRKRSPIEHLSLFSHGVPQRVAFGYQLNCLSCFVNLKHQNVQSLVSPYISCRNSPNPHARASISILRTTL